MKTNDYSWRLVAVVLSILLHLLAALSFAEQQIRADVKQSNVSKITHVRLNFSPPPALPAPQTEVQAEPKPEPVTKPKPKPKPKPEPVTKPKPKPKPQPRPKRKPKPISKPISRAEPITEPPTKPVVKDIPADPIEQNIDPRPLLKERFIAELLKHIEARKFYPKFAQRKNIQGTIKVSFTLDCDGTLKELKTQDSHKLLRKAATKAVRSSQPLPIPPSKLDCPMLISFAMDYRLK